MASAAHTIELQHLRIGMFIHLDLGWMSHPFPLSNFKISSTEQIETLRGLGLKRLRWSPERSDAVTPESAVPTAGDGGSVVGQEAVQRVRLPTQMADPEEAARQTRVALLAAQAATLRQCERQYGEACRDLRRVSDAVLGEPELARDSAKLLTHALLDKMLVDSELCVRVLGEPTGDRASAHAMNVTIISLLLGRALAMEADDLADLGLGALMHDVGKLALPDRLRLPHEDFSTAEQAMYREHVAHGVTHGRRMGLSAGALRVIAQHHEYIDGSGFPGGLALAQTSSAARIVAMVNQYDNLCNAPVPSGSLTPHEALSRMFAQMRGKFDAMLLNAFIRLMGIYPPGSLVQLTDDRYGLVVSVNSSRPLKPNVMLFDPATPPAESLFLNLETTPELGIRRSLKSEHLPARAVEYLAPRQRVAYFFDSDAAVLETGP